MISFKDFTKQTKLAQKLMAKFQSNRMTEEDKIAWLALDLKVRLLAIRDDDEQELAEDWAYHNQ